MYRVAVCEDEAILCANLCAQCESILDKLKVEHRITSFSSAEKLENALLAGEEFSLLCLDILMGGKSGMKLAQELRQRDDKTSILFITSSTEFLKDGYSVRPIQYLLKPVQAAELEQAITTDLRLYHRPSTVTFHAGGKTLVIPTEDIYYAESREHGTVLHMTHGEKFLPLSLSQTEGILPGSLFCRCHNSFLVNLSHICEEGGRTLYLTDGSDLAIGRRYIVAAAVSSTPAAQRFLFWVFTVPPPCCLNCSKNTERAQAEKRGFLLNDTILPLNDTEKRRII